MEAESGESKGIRSNKAIERPSHKSNRKKVSLLGLEVELFLGTVRVTHGQINRCWNEIRQEGSAQSRPKLRNTTNSVCLPRTSVRRGAWVKKSW